MPNLAFSCERAVLRFFPKKERRLSRVAMASVGMCMCLRREGGREGERLEGREGERV